MIEDERPKHEKLFTNQTQTAGTGTRENPCKALQQADRGSISQLGQKIHNVS